MEINYCRRCGSKLRSTKPNAYTCDNGHLIFANGSPAAGIFILCNNDTDVLLSVRGIDPHKGMLDAFGGFVDGKETLEAAATRELHEELGLRSEDYQPLTYLTSSVSDYPFNGEQQPVIGAFFWTRLTTGSIPQPRDDVAEIRQASLHDVDLAELHADDIREGIMVLRRKFPDTRHN